MEYKIIVPDKVLADLRASVSRRPGVELTDEEADKNIEIELNNFIYEKVLNYRKEIGFKETELMVKEQMEIDFKK